MTLDTITMSRSVAITLLLSFHPAASNARATAWNDTTARALIDQRQEVGAFAGVAAGFSVGGTVVWTHASGMADVGKRVPFSPDTRTRTASIAKPMTAVAIMQQVERGTIDLDASVQTYLPDFPVKQEGTISVRQLLQHTSGISAYKSMKEAENRTHYASLNEAMAIFQDRGLQSGPGTEFHYTTYGYVVLGAILEAVTGMPYEAYMRQRIWSKAGMDNTGVEGAELVGSANAALYHSNGKGKVTPERITDLSDRIPGGGLYSCVPDLLRFGDAVLNGTLITKASLAEMMRDPGLKTDGNGYGLGWYLYGENPKYGPVIGHNGSQTGASTYLMLLPDEGITIAVLSNTSGAMRAVTDITIGLFDQAAAAGTGQ